MGRIDSPCFGCEKVGCGAYHDVCPAYQKHVEERRKANQEKRMKKELEGQLIEHRNRTVRSIIRSHGGR